MTDEAIVQSLPEAPPTGIKNPQHHSALLHSSLRSSIVLITLPGTAQAVMSQLEGVQVCERALSGEVQGWE